MTRGDCATCLARQIVEVHLAMRVPLFTNYPFEAEVTVVHFGLQATQAVRYLPADAALNVLVAVRFGQIMLVNFVSDAA